jgi:hypothetical protein
VELVVGTVGMTAAAAAAADAAAADDDDDDAVPITVCVRMTSPLAASSFDARGDDIARTPAPEIDDSAGRAGTVAPANLDRDTSTGPAAGGGSAAAGRTDIDVLVVVALQLPSQPLALPSTSCAESGTLAAVRAA